MIAGKVGLAALSLAFILSGIMNLTHPSGGWKPPAADPERAAPAEFVRRARIMGVVWLLLGVLLALYCVKVFVSGY